MWGQFGDPKHGCHAESCGHCSYILGVVLHPCFFSCIHILKRKLESGLCESRVSLDTWEQK